MLFFLGAFLVPFFLMLVLCAIPLLYMELAVGQYTQNGPVGAIAKLCPLFKGKSHLSFSVFYFPDDIEVDIIYILWKTCDGFISI